MEKQKENKELKRCPFCGSNSGDYQDHADTCWIKIIRKIGWSGTSYSTQEMATAWNTRIAVKDAGQHQPNCMVLCEEDLSGMCDCGFTVNKVRCEICKNIYDMRGACERGVCPACVTTLITDNKALRAQESTGMEATLSQMLSKEQQEKWGLGEHGHKRNVQHIWCRACQAISDLEEQVTKLTQQIADINFKER